MQPLTVLDTTIRQDSVGRYCLNDLHRAAVLSGANKRTKEPSKFLESQQTIDLINEIETTQDSGSSAVQTVEGRNGGTFVVKELVYAYAMWISPAFHLKVIRGYDAMVTAELNRLNGLHMRAVRADLEYLEASENASRCGLGLRRQQDSKPEMLAGLQALRIELQPGLFTH